MDHTHCSTHQDQVDCIREHGRMIHEIQLRIEKYFAANDEKMDRLSTQNAKLCGEIIKLVAIIEEMQQKDALSSAEIIKKAILFLVGAGVGASLGLF